MRITSTGAVKFNSYGSGSHTGTSAYKLSVDSSGNIIETSIGSGAVDGAGTTNYIPKWTDGDTIGNSVVYETAAGTIGIHAGTNVEGMVDVQMKMNGVDWTYGDWDEVWCTGGAPGPKFNDCVFHLDTDRAGGVTGGIVGLAFSPGWQGHQNWGIYSTNESGGSYTQGDLRFVNQLNTPAGTFNERVTFKADGKVGIGITDPDQALEIGAAGKLKLSRADNSRSMLLYTDNSYGTIETDVDPILIKSAHRITFSTNGANERMRITETGKVGIGTTAPTGLLSLPADEETFPQIRFQSEYGTTLADCALSTEGDSGGTNLLIGSNQYYSGGTITRFTTDRSGSAINFGYTGAMKFYTGSGNAAPTERMRIIANGNVGIGLNDPGAVLEVTGNTNKLGIIRMVQRVSGVAAYGLDMGLDPTTGDPVFSRLFNDTATESFRIKRSTGLVVFAQGITLATGGSDAAPRLAFGDGNTGFFELGDNDLYITIGGTRSFIIEENAFYGANATAAMMRGAIASAATTASFCFNSDTDTGIGRAAADKLSLVAGGVGTATVTSTGVGIGTTAPESLLTLQNDDATIRIRMRQRVVLHIKLVNPLLVAT